MDDVLIIVIIFSLIILVVLILILGLMFVNNYYSNAEKTCSIVNDCDTGQDCINNICKIKPGHVCNTDNDCSEGVCSEPYFSINTSAASTTPTYNIVQYDKYKVCLPSAAKNSLATLGFPPDSYVPSYPDNYNAQNCISPTILSGDYCLLSEGSVCSTSVECENGTSCINGVCSKSLQGKICIPGKNQCINGYHCDNTFSGVKQYQGYCQATGINNGELGAFCEQNSDCNSKNCSLNSNGYNVCTNSPSIKANFLDQCSTATGTVNICQSYLSCENVPCESYPEICYYKENWDTCATGTDCPPYHVCVSNSCIYDGSSNVPFPYPNDGNISGSYIQNMDFNTFIFSGNEVSSVNMKKINTNGDLLNFTYDENQLLSVQYIDNLNILMYAYQIENEIYGITLYSFISNQYYTTSVTYTDPYLNSSPNTTPSNVSLNNITIEQGGEILYLYFNYSYDFDPNNLNILSSANYVYVVYILDITKTRLELLINLHSLSMNIIEGYVQSYWNVKVGSFEPENLISLRNPSDIQQKVNIITKRLGGLYLLESDYTYLITQADYSGPFSFSKPENIDFIAMDNNSTRCFMYSNTNKKLYFIDIVIDCGSPWCNLQIIPTNYSMPVSFTNIVNHFSVKQISNNCYELYIIDSNYNYYILKPQFGSTGSYPNIKHVITDIFIRPYPVKLNDTCSLPFQNIVLSGNNVNV